MDHYDDEMTKHLQWRVSTLKLFKEAIERYIDLLQPYNTERNKQIKQELDHMAYLYNYTKEQIKKGDGDFDIVEYGALGKTYGRLYDILWKYYGWKKQLLEEKERVTQIPAVLQGERDELEEINTVLGFGAWQKFTRHKVLVPDFYGTVPQKTENPITQQYINVQTVNGILAGTNSGTIIQNNQDKEVLTALKELAVILKEGHISDQYTAQALGNIRDLQAEMLNPYPDKTKLQKLADGLQFLANFSQLASFTISIAPHLYTIRQWITNLR